MRENFSKVRPTYLYSTCIVIVLPHITRHIWYCTCVVIVLYLYSPRYAPPTSNCVRFLAQVPDQLSSWNFNDFLFRPLRATSSGSAKQVFSKTKGSQWIILDFFGFSCPSHWRQHLDSIFNGFPHCSLLFNVSAAQFTYSVVNPVWPKTFTKKCGKLNFFSHHLLF